jgi:predicted DNA-binding transcriptional regulator AlpA
MKRKRLIAATLITKEFPRLCRGGSRSLTFTESPIDEDLQRESPSHTTGNFVMGDCEA